MSVSDEEEETPLMERSEPSFHIQGQEEIEEMDAPVQQETEEHEEEEEVNDDLLLHPYGVYSDEQVNDQIFEELHLPSGLAEEVQSAWTAFLDACDKQESAGEAIYSALFDAAPSIQSLFKRTPRAVMAMKILQGLNNLIQACHDPPILKVVVEALGFRHLDLDVTIPRVIVIRDALVELLSVELGKAIPPSSLVGLRVLLNYVGGAFIYIRVQFAERLKIIQSSWATATRKGMEDWRDPMTSMELMTVAASHADLHPKEEPPEGAIAINIAPEEKENPKRSRFAWWKGSSSSKKSSNNESGSGESPSSKVAAITNAVVPKTHQDMFLFNSAVMGFGSKVWMHDILLAFESIVTNISNPQRLQEECDILALTMGKHQGPVVLSEYKAVMLASLRSLVRNWDSQHELAWSWLWENVEHMLKAVMHKPATQFRNLKLFYERLDETAMQFMRREVYLRFFSMAPKGQDYFKQSMTRLHFIVDRMTAMTMEMYQSPKTMVNDLSAMGLRHVGYGIPVEMFSPFVSAAVQTIRELAQNDEEAEAFSWSLHLISRILCRVINEGSTIVMKAINLNSFHKLNQAAAAAPRGQRESWMLRVQVGTQAISPLIWSIQAGNLEASRAIIIDLLTIRADRDHYYFGADSLFERHPDIIKRLTVDAPALLPVFLDGMLWRSRHTENGMRRVNYWVKHLLQDADGNFAKNIEWLVNFNDPKLICHPVLVVLVDMVWKNVAFRTFLHGKLWFLFTTCLFICSQSILANATAHGDGQLSLSGRITMLVFRTFIYVFSMGEMIVKQSRLCMKDIREKNLVRIGRVPIIPEYLCKWHHACSFALMWCLILMLCVEPIVHCFFQGPAENFTKAWCRDEPWKFIYAMLSTVAILLYFVLMSDFSVLSTRISAFTLVCSRLVKELFLFLFVTGVCTIAFACSISALRQDSEYFDTSYDAFLHLWKMLLGMMPPAVFHDLEDEVPALFIMLAIFVVVASIFLTSIFIAQLSSAYQATFNDMVGFARLNRGHIVVATMPKVPEQRWKDYLESLHLDRRIEFGEGDIGLAGAIQILEPASLNQEPQVCPVCHGERVHRYAGTTSREAPWPIVEIESAEMDLETKLARMEKLIQASMKKIVKLTKSQASSSSKGLGNSQRFESSNGSSESSS